MTPEWRLANAVLALFLQLCRSLAERGLLSPSDVDEFSDTLTSILENQGSEQSEPDDMSANYEAQLGPLLAELRRVAERKS